MTSPITPLPAVTVYGKRGCPGCDATYRSLRALGIAFIGIDTDLIEGAAQQVRELGFSSLPVVVVAGTETRERETWSGFRPDRLRKLLPAVGQAA